ncbi:MAG TPA: hypothetical protein VMR08_03340 [Patescibacteria group bacterium]|jgi:hypothetical protein|nr:hypothetical protein [Patescibacteria group bacterium]
MGVEREPTPIDPDTGLVLDSISKICPGGDTCASHLKNPKRGCHDSDHHHWHYKFEFEKDGRESQPWQLRHSPFAIEPDRPRCEHDEWHDKHLPPSFPKNELVVAAYIDQSKRLAKLGDSAIRLSRQRLELDELYLQANPSEERITTLSRRLPGAYEEVEMLGLVVMRADLLPNQVKANPFDYIYRYEPEASRDLATVMVRSALHLDVLQAAA